MHNNYWCNSNKDAIHRIIREARRILIDNEVTHEDERITIMPNRLESIGKSYYFFSPSNIRIHFSILSRDQILVYQIFPLRSENWNLSPPSFVNLLKSLILYPTPFWLK